MSGCLHAPMQAHLAHEDPASVALDLLALHPDKRFSALARLPVSMRPTVELMLAQLVSSFA